MLDDPFSALDISTEKKIYNNLCDIAKNNIVIIMTHRLYMFPKMDKVIWMDNGKAIVGNTRRDYVTVSAVQEDV